ncbi:MAG: flagellar hook-basal body complex protein FliE [Verrucomicrobiota bacterium]
MSGVDALLAAKSEIRSQSLSPTHAFPDINQQELKGKHSVAKPFEIPAPVQHVAGPLHVQSMENTPETWGHMVQQMVRDVNTVQKTAGEKVRDVLQGGPTSVHEAMIASQKSSVSFQMLSEVRNKVIDSYKEIMRMQV